ncbi:MAG: sensor histidine kinase [Gammaproteobacteria bacterium]|nr:sensor histidine kinase [Gammaproteobacteria bacterium]
MDRPTRFIIPELCNVASLAVLVLVGQLLVLVLLLSGEVSWARFALMSLFVQWVALTSAGLLCWSRQLLGNLGPTKGAVAAFLIVMVVTLVVGIAADFVMFGFDRGVVWRENGSRVLISGVLTGMVLRYFWVQERLREKEQSELQSRIQALQSRIRPHFLFNSMNIIASLIPTDPDIAETVVEDLSELFRASLNDAGNQVDLADELALCERYVRIEGLRLGDRLVLDWQIEETGQPVKIPLLTLQPLLENAIYHGIQPLPEGGTIQVKLWFDQEIVNVTITSPMPPERYRAQTTGNKMALNNIRSRLNVLYGDVAELTAEVVGEKYVTALRYPMRYE